VTIIFTGVLILGALTAIMTTLDLKSVTAVCGISALLGLMTVCIMSKVYMVKTMPLWNSWTTPVEFVSSAILLGLIQYLFILAGHGGTVDILADENILLLLIMICVVVKLFVVQRPSMLQQGGNRTVSECCRARLVLLLSALLFLSAAFILDSFVALWVTGVLLLLSELKGRLNFFESVYKLGL